MLYSRYAAPEGPFAARGDFSGRHTAMKSKLRILLMTALCLVCLFAFTACGSGVEIGANGNWFVDGKDTGVSAAGEEKGRFFGGTWVERGRF